MSLARKLFNVIDVFEFFQISSEETDVLKAACWFRWKSREQIIQWGVQINLSNFIMLLKGKLKKREESIMIFRY